MLVLSFLVVSGLEFRAIGVFIGRARELTLLEGHLDHVCEGSERPGRALLVRGRRRVGKSRPLEEFIARSSVPAVFFTVSTQGAPASYEGTLMMARVAAAKKSKGKAALVACRL